jgi:hypothetical protein
MIGFFNEDENALWSGRYEPTETSVQKLDAEKNSIDCAIKNWKMNLMLSFEKFGAKMNSMAKCASHNTNVRRLTWTSWKVNILLSLTDTPPPNIFKNSNSKTDG